MTRLRNLSPPDFEDLCRDILQAETGQRFSAFGAGADGGVDGRHSKGLESTIIQCKHYVNSTFSQLKSALKKEVPKIDLLKPSRYIFLTSQSLTPARSNQLANILGDRLKHPEDIWGAEDIESALKRHPDIEKAQIKLWMTSTAVLEKVLQSGLETHTAATKAEILDELQVYVRNPSFDAAFEKLEKNRVLVVSGPPGVGKTTLAKMLTYQYLNDDWQFCAIRSLDDGFAKLDEEKISAISSACLDTAPHPSGYVLDMLKRARDITQRLGRHVGVSCRRGQLGVAKEHLDHAHVRVGLQLRQVQMPVMVTAIGRPRNSSFWPSLRRITTSS
jgi:hypothetical protein